MTKTVFKLTASWNYKKEETWLNEMSKKGWHLTEPKHVLFTFTEGEPDKYRYALEYLDVSGEGMQEYFAFLEETGIEIIGHTMNWAYYRKLNDGKPFEIFSDDESKIKHWNRLRYLILLIAGFETYFMITFWMQIINGDSSVFTLIPTVFITLVVLLLAWSNFRIWMQISELKKNRRN